MQILDISNLNVLELLPILVVAIILFAIAKGVTLPAEYTKRRIIREAMMKRNAEYKDLERLAKQRAMREFEVDGRNEFAVE